MRHICVLSLYVNPSNISRNQLTKIHFCPQEVRESIKYFEELTHQNCHGFLSSGSTSPYSSFLSLTDSLPLLSPGQRVCNIAPAASHAINLLNLTLFIVQRVRLFLCRFLMFLINIHSKENVPHMYFCCICNRMSTPSLMFFHSSDRWCRQYPYSESTSNLPSRSRKHAARP